MYIHRIQFILCNNKLYSQKIGANLIWHLTCNKLIILYVHVRIMPAMWPASQPCAIWCMPRPDLHVLDVLLLEPGMSEYSNIQKI